MEKQYTARGRGAWRLKAQELRDSGQKYSAADVRFTIKGDRVYAILMQRPEDSKVLIKSLAKSEETKTDDCVELLGYSEPLMFSQITTGLEVTLPETPGKQIICLRVSFHYSLRFQI